MIDIKQFTFGLDSQSGDPLVYLVGHFYITEMLKINLDVDREVCLWTNCHIFVVDPDRSSG